jgi:multidrug efflux pump subunit AcrB
VIARFIYHHPRYFVLIILCTLAVGISSFTSIARQEDPSLSNFVATVTTFFPGATPDRVEALVTRPLENEFRQIPEIQEIYTTSSAGVSFFNMRLIDELTEEGQERVWTEVRDAIGDAAQQFPPGVAEPVFDDGRMTSFTAIVALTAKDGADLPLSLLNRLAQDFADRARNQPNTKLVEIFGEPEEEIRVEVDEAGLTARGLDIARVAGALQAADAKVSAGRATGSGNDLLIELAGDFTTTDRIRNVIVAIGADGTVTRVGDIAQVTKAAITPPRSMAIAQGKPAILVGSVMEPDHQVDVWSDVFGELVAEFRAQAPASLDITITYDQKPYAVHRLANVGTNLGIGVLLVILVLLFTLGWRAALVVAIILPVCGLISIAILERSGLALHQMSISGLIVALGLLVDGSIVMTDEIRKRLLNGDKRLDAITGSVDRLRVPLISSAVTTILAFMPMAVMPGPGGEFVGAIARSVIIMLTVSTVLALIVTPVLASWLLPKREQSERHWYLGGAPSGRMGDALVGALDWTLAHPLAGIALALALPVTGFLSFSTLTAQFFPGTDRDQAYIQVKLADGRSIAESHDLARAIDAKLRAEPLIERVDWTIGESAPAFYYNMYRMKERIPSWSEALIITRDENRTDALIRRLQNELDEDYPQAQIFVRGIYQGPPVVAPLEIEIFGPNLDILRELGDAFRARMDVVPVVTHTTVGLIGGAPKVVFKLEEEQLRLANLQLTDVARTLNNKLLGATGGEIIEGTERLPVRVRLNERDWGGAEQVANLRFGLPGQDPQGAIRAVPLDALGTPSVEPSQSPITRQNGQRYTVVQGYLRRGILPEEAMKELRADLRDNPIEMPPGYSWREGGDADERAGVVDDLMAPMGFILSGLLATIVMTFNSWRLSGIAFLVCICSLGLSLLALAIFRYPFGIQALIGVIGSIGVSINAAIIIMTALQADESACRGEPLGIRRVVMDSSRHIISTTVTTFGGFLPLILEGSEFWPPFAMAIAGGVLLSTIISFFLVPPLFMLASRTRKAGLDALPPEAPTEVVVP